MLVLVTGGRQEFSYFDPTQMLSFRHEPEFMASDQHSYRQRFTTCNSGI